MQWERESEVRKEGRAVLWPHGHRFVLSDGRRFTNLKCAEHSAASLVDKAVEDTVTGIVYGVPVEGKVQ
jgi:hypothetical protein